MKSNKILVLLAVFLAFAAGWFLRNPAAEHDHSAEKSQDAASIWTCSMHPQIRQNEPGACPLCGMDLIPATSDDSLGPWQLKLSARAQKLAEIQTTPVRRQFVAREIPMVGKVEYDEKRVGVISAWADGRVDRLFVDFTGISVHKDDHLVDLYSPDLLSAQQELLSASGSFRTATQSNMRGALKRVMASREKLRLYGLNPKQIAEIERRGTATDLLTVYSHLEGVVIDKHVVLGKYVKRYLERILPAAGKRAGEA